MNLRNLQEKDTPMMLEWMHDKDVIQFLKTNFAGMSIDDCQKFIAGADKENKDIHKAIVNEEDEYMGTVSLKHIANNMAEFAIAIRKKAMAKGIASAAMREIIRYGFEEKKLNVIYWCVDEKNQRACHFYDKNKYNKIDIRNSEIIYLNAKKYYTVSQIEHYLWYAVYREG